jgi:hypothetical protein
MQASGLFDVEDKRGKYGLVHNIGLGGAVVVSLLRRPEFYKAGGVDGRDRLDLFFTPEIIACSRLTVLLESGTTMPMNANQSL